MNTFSENLPENQKTSEIQGSNGNVSVKNEPEMTETCEMTKEFDKSQTDKARFSALQGKYGSEYQTTRLSEKDLALIPEEKPEIGKTEPHESADAFSPISTVKAETSQIQSSLPEKSVESCPVKFNFSEQDKRLFQALKDEIGSERDFTLEREKQSKNGVFLLKEDILKIESELARPKLFTKPKPQKITFFCCWFSWSY